MRIWEILFLLSLAAIPIQLGKIIFVNNSYVLGIPIDYLALTIYLSDIFILLLIVSKLAFSQIDYAKNFKYSVFLFVFATYLFVSALYVSDSRLTGTIFASRIFLYGIFAHIVCDLFSKQKLRESIKFILNFSLAWQSVLIVLEFLSQRSLGLWLLGERSFDASTVNIAHIDFAGRQFLRPYGTFPHPNVAAVFLLTFLLIVLVLDEKKPKTIFQKIIIYLAILAIILTFSKTAIAILVLITLFFIKNKKTIALATIAAILALATAILNPEIIPVPSVAERLMLIQSSLDLTLKSPFFGVGTTNFIRELAKLNLFSLAQTRLLQPVHNVFLLVMVENGLIGLFFLAAILYIVSQKINSRYKFLIFLVILIFGSIDHFYWTLHQGQLLFWLSLGFILSSKTSKAQK